MSSISSSTPIEKKNNLDDDNVMWVRLQFEPHHQEIITKLLKQKELREKYREVRIPSAPPRNEWMTVDECFDDIIDSVEEICKENDKG